MSLPLLYVAGEKLFPLNYDVFCFIRLTDCTLVSVSDSLRSLSHSPSHRGWATHGHLDGALTCPAVEPLPSQFH